MNLLLDPKDLQKSFQAAKPFPHIAMEGLFPDSVLDGVLRDFPSPGDIDWKVMVTAREKKLGTKNLSGLSDSTRHFLLWLNSGPMIDFLEKLTGITGLIPDPHYWGGGLHQIEQGGFLKIHADFNWHNRLALCRRLNLLIYLNKDWDEEYGGQLELWDKNMKECVHKIVPTFNKAVVFATTDFAFHGHPTPLTCPENKTRKSIALYYYTNGRPKDEVSDVHSTLYQRRGPIDWKESRKDMAIAFTKKLIPPIVFDAKRYLKVKYFPNAH